jgi:hypothetical protein
MKRCCIEGVEPPHRCKSFSVRFSVIFLMIFHSLFHSH